MITDFDPVHNAIKTKRQRKDGTVSAFLEGGAFSKLRVMISWREDLSADENHRRAALVLIEKLHWHGDWIGAEAPGELGNNYVFVNLDSLISLHV